MAKFESNVQYIKYLVNKEVSKRFFENTLENTLESYVDIAEKIIPGPKAMFRCCIYKERHIIEERVKVSLEPRKDDENVIKVLSSACDECPVDRFVVTEACRGCMAHKCFENCPKNAITIVNHRAYINQELCIECGKCKAVCPFNAISEVKRPCIRSCPTGAVSMDENKKAQIDNNKCVSCGSCVYQCPFGAIIDKPFIVEVLNLIKNSSNNTNYKVIALIAPAISSQFTEVPLGKVVTAIKELGFYDVYEAALGADIVALHEAEEFCETVGEKGWKTTSCCPAFVSYVQKTYPQYMENVSTTVSPMIAAARLIKSIEKDAKVVFIGPCTAKKMEIRQEDIKDAVEEVLTFEELRSLFDAKEIKLAECEESELANASYFGRIFGRTGGVTDAVLSAKESKNLDVEVKPVKCNGLDECIKNFKLASFGRLPGNFVEGMACKGGCAGGAASISHDARAVNDVEKYGKNATYAKSLDAIEKYDLSTINLEREFSYEKKGVNS